jgi:hypothetical protein
VNGISDSQAAALIAAYLWITHGDISREHAIKMAWLFIKESHGIFNPREEFCPLCGREGKLARFRRIKEKPSTEAAPVTDLEQRK